jgi:hypothetical protein
MVEEGPLERSAALGIKNRRITVKLAEIPAEKPLVRGVPPDADPPLVQTARDRLHRSLYPGLRRVDCSFAHGRLRLSGRLQSYFEKQLAQETVARISGVTDVVNDIDVHYPDDGSGPSGHRVTSAHGESTRI